VAQPALQLLRQVAPAKSPNDQLTAAQIAAIEGSAVNFKDFLDGILSQIKRIIHGGDAGDWHVDIVTEFGANASLKSLLLSAGGLQTLDDKRKPALVTTADGDAALASGITNTPAANGYVQVFVNGHRVSVADALITPGSCYFSGDGGTTRRLVKDIVATDTLHWVGSVAGYQLAVGDLIDLDYEETPP
jgi:hypothetical protein